MGVSENWIAQVTALWTQVLEAVSKTLAPAEREVFLGDIEELGLRGPQATLGLLGLVMRRQVQQWFYWQPWLVLIAAILPTSLLLTAISKNLAGLDAVYLWMYADNWTSTYLVPGYFWSQLVPQLGDMALSWLVLASWSWTGGFALASISRLATGANILMVTGVSIAAETYAMHTHELTVRNPGNDPVFADTFYRIIFPVLLQVLLVVLPFAYGMRSKRKLASCPSALRSILWTSIAVTAISLLSDNIVRSPLRIIFRISFVSTLMPLAIAGPAVYFILTRLIRFWPHGTATNPSSTSLRP